MQFIAGVRKKSKAVIAIYLYASEGFCFTLLENDVGYFTMVYILEDISV